MNKPGVQCCWESVKSDCNKKMRDEWKEILYEKIVLRVALFIYS